MAIVINGSGTVTGISVGGLPDGIVDAGTLATNSVDSAELIDGSIDNSHLADDAVGLAEMATGTDGNIISYDASGNPVAIATGDDGQVLTSAGAGAPPAFEDVAASDNTPSFSAYLSANQTISSNVYTKMNFDTEHWDSNGAYDTTNKRFTVPSGEAGKYVISIFMRQSGVSQEAMNYPIVIYKNGAAIQHISTTFGNDQNRFAENFTWVMPLAESDYVEAWTNCGDEMDWSSGANASQWSGFKLIGV